MSDKINRASFPRGLPAPHHLSDRGDVWTQGSVFFPALSLGPLPYFEQIASTFIEYGFFLMDLEEHFFSVFFLLNFSSALTPGIT